MAARVGLFSTRMRGNGRRLVATDWLFLMNIPSRSAKQDPDDSITEALESLGQSMSGGALKGDFPGSGAFTDPDVMATLANLPPSAGRINPVAASSAHNTFSYAGSMFDEDEISPYLDDEAEVPIVGRKRNRRSRRSLWLPLILVSLTQLGVIAAVGLMAWPDIKGKILQEAAASLIGEKDETEVLQKRLEIGEKRIDALLSEVVTMNRRLELRLELSPEDVRAELEFLGARNRLLRLADAAIQKADRVAFDQLLKVADEAGEEKLRNGAMSEIQRVKFAYLNGLSTPGHALPVGHLFPSLRDKDEMALGTDQLIKILQDQGIEAEHRTRAAYLLADHRNVQAVETLVGAIANDANLDVVREATLTFSEMTGYRGDELLDTAGLAEWWRENSSAVKLALGN